MLKIKIFDVSYTSGGGNITDMLSLPYSYKFGDILGGLSSGDKVCPFRDSVSLALIKELEGAVPDGDWYSVVYPDGARRPMWNMSADTKYALLCLTKSRKTQFREAARYTAYDPDMTRALEALARLDEEIPLLVHTGDERYRGKLDIPDKLCPCVIEYPDGSTERLTSGKSLNVKYDWIRDIPDIIRCIGGDLGRDRLIFAHPPLPMKGYGSRAVENYMSERSAVAHGEITAVYFRCFPDGRTEAGELPLGTSISFEEALERAAALWDEGVSGTFCAVLNSIPYNRYDFAPEKYIEVDGREKSGSIYEWFFSDDGRRIAVYSGLGGVREFIGFLANSYPDSKENSHDKNKDT